MSEARAALVAKAIEARIILVQHFPDIAADIGILLADHARLVEELVAAEQERDGLSIHNRNLLVVEADYRAEINGLKAFLAAGEDRSLRTLLNAYRNKHEGCRAENSEVGSWGENVSYDSRCLLCRQVDARLATLPPRETGGR